VVNFGADLNQRPELRFKRLVHTTVWRLSKLIWAVERASFDLPSSEMFSPFVVATARKPVR
jgi:hypothetical protein